MRIIISAGIDTEATEKEVRKELRELLRKFGIGTYVITGKNETIREDFK